VANRNAGFAGNCNQGIRMDEDKMEGIRKRQRWGEYEINDVVK